MASARSRSIAQSPLGMPHRHPLGFVAYLPHKSSMRLRRVFHRDDIREPRLTHRQTDKRPRVDGYRLKAATSH
jgi:hypothetical protein